MKKRISLLAATGLVAVGLAATPAHAADPVFTLTSPAEIGLHPHPGQDGRPQTTTVDFRVENETGSVFDRQSTYTIDLGALKGVVDVKLNQDQAGDCSLAATTVTCKDWAIWTHGSGVVSLDLAAAKGSKTGAVVDLTMTGAAEGATFKPTTTKVEVGGPDLVMEKAALKAKLTPGQSQPLPIVFGNTGTESVDGVALELQTTHGMGLVEEYDNCAYSEDDSAGQPWNVGWGTTVCTFDNVVKPGEVYEIADALTLEAAPHAFIEGLLYGVHQAGDQPKSTLKFTTPRTGKKLGLKARSAKAAPNAADLDPWNNQHEFDFAVKNTADLVSSASSAEGKAGETVKVELGFRNDGPAWVAYLRSGEDVAMADIVIPAGAKVTKAPEICRATTADGGYREKHLGAPRYFCPTTHVIGEKQKFGFPFELKIEKVVVDATGSVSVGAWSPEGATPPSWDPKHANNKAAFVINGKGVTPTPAPTAASPTPTAPTSPTATPGTSTTPSPSPSASTGNGKTPSGGLAETGSTAGPVLIAGAMLVAAGGAVFLVFRRRATGRA
ncbi:LPXTG cell wall anchor domain-containing protein [Streptomyces sp. H27-H1]|uniref:LPXTG cell wall anchor domain-containing protein n=1 Tax=Streptomyces sp. H27-H1 TaxID=2996461 RepID=UPI00226ED1F0|nr:LPXTG cell wall anchor domain-containing protein [Streptomyces sp. H27-H1]MCY0926070.1 LPXTG cell wall anchor domain-containing protein [Streptomyces sp. H27-H1]